LAIKNLGYRGRFAPSPTGPLHFGSLYTAVASFLQARSKHGQWLLRIDDLDPFRCKPQYSHTILSTLERYGLHWDEEVLYQSKRHAVYKEALADLQKKQYLYRCQCSRKDLAKRQLSHGIYDQHCLNQPPLKQQASAYRIKVGTSIVSFVDLIQGDCQQNLKEQLGDFILYRKDQVYAYHLAVILDDAEQNISEVLRGHDLLDSSYRQIFLQKIFHLNTPHYAHIPVINGPKDIKLSKQTFAEDIALAPTRETLIKVFSHLNLNPSKELLDLTPSDILNWGVQQWSIEKIKPLASIPL